MIGHYQPMADSGARIFDKIRPARTKAFSAVTSENTGKHPERAFAGALKERAKQAQKAGGLFGTPALARNPIT